jgi:hypothetical protein
MTAPVLRSPADVHADWLTEALRADGLLHVARVVDFDVEPIGAGLMGTCVRFILTLDHDEPGAPRSVVGKFAAEDEQARAFMASTGYRNEVCFYQHFARRLSVRSPRCSFAAIDDDGWFTLLLEDMAPAVPGDQLAGCSVEQVEDALRELVGLHAPLWGDLALAEHGCFASNRRVDPELFATGLSASIPGFLERYAPALDAPAVDFYERLARGAPHWFRARPAPTTLVHSDYRPDNLLFGAIEGGRKVAVVDWQGLGYGSGPADVGFLVGNALTVADRRAHETRLVREYHAQLTLARVAAYDWDQCWHDYRASLLSPMLTTIFGAMYGIRTERGDRMFELMAQRHATQILDLGADEFLDRSGGGSSPGDPTNHRQNGEGSGR